MNPLLSRLRGTTAFHTVDDARVAARRVLPRTVFDFVDGGAERELTLADNRRSFEDLAFRPSMAVDVRDPKLATSILGTPISAPVAFAPCGLMGTVHPEAEPAVARVAADAGTLAVFSTYSSATLEEISESANGSKWFQLYFLGGRAGAEVLIERARNAGYGALVVTVDTIVAGNRERDLRNKVTYPLRAGLREARTFGPQVALRPGWLYRFARAGFPLDVANARPVAGAPNVDMGELISGAPPTWADLTWIREQWGGPLLVKGIMTADDARRALAAGADGVIVSNHGGRQLDGVPGAARMLPEVIDAVDGAVEVLVDGGVRRGSDVVKALALGARAVLIGRPYIYGLGAGGQAGVARVLDILVEEMERTMQLLGCSSVADLDRGHLWNVDAVCGDRVD